MTIAQHHGPPGTLTDKAHIESFFSHLVRTSLRAYRVPFL